MFNFSNTLPFSEESRIVDLVSQDGLILGSLEERWRQNARVVEAAVKQNGIAIAFAPFFRANREMGYLAVGSNGLAYCWLHPRLRKDKIIKRIAQENFPKRLPSFLVKAVEISKRIFFLSPGIYQENQELRFLDQELIFLQERGFSNQRVHVCCENSAKTFFVRDARVPLLNREQLIPYSPSDIKSWDSWGPKWNAILPYAYKQSLLEGKVGYFGKGFYRSNTRQSVVTCCELGLPYVLGSTTIEGGNCFLLLDQGIKKAIVGEWSLYFSYYALKEQGFFDEDDAEEINRVENPSLEDFRFARNLDLHKKQKQNFETYQKEKEEISDIYEQEVAAIDLLCVIDKEAREKLRAEAENKYYVALEALQKKSVTYNNELEKKVIAPISEEDRKIYWEKAKKIHVRLEKTKGRMAEELQVNHEDLILLPQTDFHLDMRMWVTPDGQVVLHDSVLAEHFLKTIQQLPGLSERARQFVNGYLKTAALHAQVFRDVEQKQESLLTERGFRVHRMPAVFDFPGISQLNYCNGIFLQNQSMESVQNVFLTTGPSFEEELPVHESFKKLFIYTFPEMKFREVKGMSEFIAQTMGGLHCLTFEL